MRHPVLAGLVPQGDFVGGKHRAPEGRSRATIEGLHEAIVDRATWDIVQDRLESRQRRKGPSEGLPYAGGLIRCAHCTAAVTGHRSRGRHGKVYLYYACRRAGRGCSGPGAYIRQDALEKQLVSEIERLEFDEEALEDFRSAVESSHELESAQVEEDRARLSRERAALERKLKGALSHLLAERITSQEYDEAAADLRARVDTVDAQLAGLTNVDRDWRDEVVAIVKAVRELPERFRKTKEGSKRRALLEILSSNPLLRGDQVELHFAEPLDSVAIAADTSRSAVISLETRKKQWRRERDGVQTLLRSDPALLARAGRLRMACSA